MFKNHPKGLIAASLSNMGERFGYYIMNAVLVLFLCSKFGMSDSTAASIYAVFMASIYVLSLAGGALADRLQNYKGVIITGLVIMAVGYLLLAIPVTATASTQTLLIVVICAALMLIAVGNGLFKGNLLAIVGQLYDNYEAEAAAQGAEALEKAKGKRDMGFQIYYVFINIGSLFAPFIAPLLRQWWLSKHGFKYVAELPALCHAYIDSAGAPSAEKARLLGEYMAQAGGTVSMDGCQAYLEVFNQGVHFAFITSVAMMLVSLGIFLSNRRRFPTPAGKKSGLVSQEYTPEEKRAKAKELRQRLYALFAILAVVIFFWLSYDQKSVAMAFFARDFVRSDQFPPEFWQAFNPFFVIVLTPIIMWFFSALARRGKAISTPRKIAAGMIVAALTFAFLAVYCYMRGYPSGDAFTLLDAGERAGMKAGAWVMIVTFFLLTVAELLISPLGLSFVSKVAPKNMLGLCQGLWLATSAVSSLLLPIGTVLYTKTPQWVAWGCFVALCLLCAGVMLAMVRWLERITGNE